MVPNLKIDEADLGSAMMLAHRIYNQCFPVEGCKTPGLVMFGEQLFEWYGGVRWVPRSKAWLKKTVLEALKTVVFHGSDDHGQFEKGVNIDRGMTEDVVYFIELEASATMPTTPFWLEPAEGLPNPGHVIPFANCLVDVMASVEKGEIVTMDHPGRLFTVGSLTVDWDPEATCPTWDRCMAEWGGGDPQWTELRERAYGYSLMGTREFEKWLFEYGKARGGKGMGIRVLEKLLGDHAVIGTDGINLNKTHALQNKRLAQCLVINEAHSLKGHQAARLSSLLKQIVGRDRIEVDIKYGEIMSHRFPAFPIIQANEIVRLPNSGRALSCKMLPLPFDVSFVGKEDPNLEAKLAAELPGIAKRLVEAAIRLMGAKTIEERWPLPERSQQLLETYEVQTNPWDVFLNRYFVEDPDGFVANGSLHAMRTRFEGEIDDPLVFQKSTGGRVLQERFSQALRQHSSWVITPARRNKNTIRGLAGLRLKEEE